MINIVRYIALQSENPLCRESASQQKCSTLHKAIPRVKTLHKIIPHVKTLHKIIPHVKTLHKVIPHVKTLQKMMPHVKTLHKAIPRVKTLHKTILHVKVLLFLYCPVLFSLEQWCNAMNIALSVIIFVHSIALQSESPLCRESASQQKCATLHKVTPKFS